MTSPRLQKAPSDAAQAYPKSGQHRLSMPRWMEGRFSNRPIPVSDVGMGSAVGIAGPSSKIVLSQFYRQEAADFFAASCRAWYDERSIRWLNRRPRTAGMLATTATRRSKGNGSYCNMLPETCQSEVGNRQKFRSRAGQLKASSVTIVTNGHRFGALSLLGDF